MADKEVAIKINVDADGGAKSLSELKKEFKETQKTLEGLTIGTKEYVNTLQRLGGIKDEIGDLNDTIKTFNPEGKVQAFGNVMGGVASGIQGAVGAMALFGVESEETQKMLLKVQAASAFADGIKGVIGLGDSFKNLQLVLGKTVLGQKLVTAGQWLWNAAISANPIGLIIIALAALVTGIGYFIGSTNNAEAAQDRLNKKLEAENKAIQEGLNLLELKNSQIDKDNKAIIAKLQAQGASEETLLAFKLKALDDESIAAKKVYSEKLQLYNNDKKVYEGLRALKKDSNDEDDIKELADLKAKLTAAFIETTKLYNALGDAKKEADNLVAADETKNRNKRIADDKKAAEEKKKTDEEKAKKEIEGYRKAEGEYDIYLKKLKAIKDKADSDEAQGNADALAIAEEWLKSKNALEEYYNQKTKAGRLQSLKEQFDAELLLLEGDQAAKDLLTAKYNVAANAIRKENSTISFGEQRAELTLQLEADLLAVGDNEEAKLELKKEYAKKNKELNIQEVNANLEIAQQSNDAMQGLSDLFFSVKMANLEKGSAAELKAAKQQFKVNKALAITNGIISTIQGVINALTAQSSLPEPYATILKVVSAVSVAAAGAANVAKISAQQFNPGTTSGGGGGATASLGSAGGGVALAPPSSGSTQLNADGTIKAAIGNNQPVVKAVVVETDITTSQKRVNTIEERASL
jgi:hypothetical protein